MRCIEMKTLNYDHSHAIHHAREHSSNIAHMNLKVLQITLLTFSFLLQQSTQIDVEFEVKKIAPKNPNRRCVRKVAMII